MQPKKDRMKLEEKLKLKFEELAETATPLKGGSQYGQVKNDDHASSCKGWLTSAQNLVHLIVANPQNPYRTSVDHICAKDRGLCIHQSVGEVSQILDALLRDVKNGLLSSIENQTKALVFDDFLDHAKEYRKEGMKNEAGVIAGVVFEDTIRNLCRNNSISERGIKLDQLITDLTKSELINQVKAKRARVAAHVRTKATHAQWEEFDLNDVGTTIEFTEELINTKLG